MEKKETAGYFPIPIKLLSHIIFYISMVIVVTGALNYFLFWNILPQSFVFIGVGLFILNLFLIASSQK